MMRAAAPFSFFLLLQKTTNKKKKKKTTQNKFTQESKLQSTPPPPTQSTRDKNTYGKIQNWVVMKTSLFLMMRTSMKKQAKKQKTNQTNKELKKSLYPKLCFCARENRHPLLHNKNHTVTKYIEHHQLNFALLCFALLCLVLLLPAFFWLSIYL
jgi:hypothetical protein